MKNIKILLFLLVGFTLASVYADSQEVAQMLERAKSLPYGNDQLGIIFKILRPSSGATSEQIQEAENFAVFQDSKRRHAGW